MGEKLTQGLPPSLPTETIYKVEKLQGGEKGEYIIYGYWVAENFKEKKHEIISINMGDKSLMGDVTMHFKFLNPLNRTTAPLSIIVFLEKVPGDYPMVMLTRLINVKDYQNSRGKETNVVFNQTALRSYMDYNVKWEEVTDENNGFMHGNNVIIEFELKHTKVQQPITPIPLSELMKRKEPTRHIRRVGVDKTKEKTGHVGIMQTANSLFAYFAMVLFHDKSFTDLCKKIDASRINEAPYAKQLNSFFNQLAKSETAVNPSELLKAFNADIGYEIPDFELQLIQNFFNNLGGSNISSHIAAAATTKYNRLKIKANNGQVFESTPEKMFCFNLPCPVENEINLSELLKRFQTEGYTLSDYSIGDERCDIIVRPQVLQLPDLLILTVYRGQSDSRGNIVMRQNRINAPSILNTSVLAEGNPMFDVSSGTEYDLVGLITSDRSDPKAQKNEAFVRAKDRWIAVQNESVKIITEEDALAVRNASIFVYQCRSSLYAVTEDDLRRSTLSSELGFGFQTGKRIQENLLDKSAIIVPLRGHVARGDDRLVGRVLTVTPRFVDEGGKLPLFVKFFFGVEDDLAPCEFLFAALVDPERKVESLEREIREVIGAVDGQLRFSFCHTENAEADLFVLEEGGTIELAEVDGVALIVAEFVTPPSKMTYVRAKALQLNTGKVERAPLKADVVDDYTYIPGVNDDSAIVPENAAWYFSGLYRPVSVAVMVEEDEGKFVEGDMGFVVPAHMPLSHLLEQMGITSIGVKNSSGEIVEVVDEDLSNIALNYEKPKRPVVVYVNDN